MGKLSNAALLLRLHKAVRVLLYVVCVQERQHIKKVSLHLLHSWSPAAASKDTNSSSSSSSNTVSLQHSHPTDLQQQQPAGAAAAADSSQGTEQDGMLPDMQPGTFPSTLLESRDKGTAQPFTDEQVTWPLLLPFLLLSQLFPLPSFIRRESGLFPALLKGS
jgi:hypothetical protein